MNGMRMGASHRLDLGVQWVKKFKRAEQILSFDIYNTYARRNPFFYIIERNDPTIFDFGSLGGTANYSLKKFSLFPLIPSISYTLNF